MKTLRAIQCLLFLILAIPLSNTAQNYKQNQEYIKEIIKEKLRVDASQVETFVEPDYYFEDGIARYRRSDGSEIQVTDVTIAESEVHAAINPSDSNNIVLSPIRLIPFGGYTLPIYYTHNFGKTWSASDFNPRPNDSNANVLGGGDPVFAFDADGKLYYSWIALYRTTATSYHWGLLWAYSNDGGNTWLKTDSNYICLSSGAGFVSLPIISDKQWMATDQSGGQYHGNLYVSYLKAEMQTGKIRIVVQRKQADSIEFDLDPVEISDGSFASVQFGNVAVDANGYVHVTFCDDQSSLWHAYSDDGGVNYSTPKRISDFLMPEAIRGIKSAGSSPRIYPAPHLAVDNSSSNYAGNLYLTWTAKGLTKDENSGADVYFVRSTDGGNTWETPIIVNDDERGLPKDQFYSNITVNEEGVVILGWYDARHSVSNTQNEITQYYLAYSFNGGQSFTTNFNVSSAFTDFSTVGDKNNQFGIGEYNSVVATKGYAIPVWSDGRKGDGDLDIYVAFAELEKDPQSIPEVRQVDGLFQLHALSPNPANSFIEIDYELLEASRVAFKILTIDGKWIAQKNEDLQTADKHSCRLDTRKLPNGHYILLFDTEFGRISQKFSIKR
jgi:hypothetical protein